MSKYVYSIKSGESSCTYGGLCLLFKQMYIADTVVNRPFVTIFIDLIHRNNEI